MLLPEMLREQADGLDELTLELPDGARAADLVDQLSRRWPGLGRRLREDSGGLRRHVDLLVDGRDVRTPDGVRTGLRDGAVVHVLPSVAEPAGEALPRRPRYGTFVPRFGRHVK